MKTDTFWDTYKVFIIGLAGAALVALQQFAFQPEISWKAVGLAVGLALVGYIAQNWRGQSLSIIGIIGNAAFAFTSVHETGNFTWSQFIIQLLLVFGFAAMPDPKSRGYENTAVIKNAKVEGEQNVPAALTNSQIKEAAVNHKKF
jgi:hypothetical protein